MSVGALNRHCLLVPTTRDAALAPACLPGGGAFLTTCDAAARVVMAPAQLPVGVLTALLDGPFFLWLLILRSRER